MHWHKGYAVARAGAVLSKCSKQETELNIGHVVSEIEREFGNLGGKMFYLYSIHLLYRELREFFDIKVRRQ